jgi:hypothetical protein
MAEESVRLARERDTNLVAGGKSLSGGTRHSPAVQVVVSEATHAKLKALAAASRVRRVRTKRNAYRLIRGS